MRAMLSLLGMYRHDPDILDDLALPEAMEEDREVLMDNLLLETAELEIIYPEPYILRHAIGAWSKKNCPIWEKLYETTQYEYNPIWNKDGTVIETETGSRDLSGDENRNGKSEQNGKAVSSGTNEANQEDNHYVFGYNTEDAAQSDRDTMNSNSKDRVETSNSATGSSEDTLNRSENETYEHTITREEKGNIGVTSTQSMIREQRDVVLFNVMDHIINDFKNRFCLLVY